MELNSGNDLISLKESIQTQFSPTTESPLSFVEADHYARCNALTVDSLAFDWQRLVEHDHAINSTLDDLEPGQLIEHIQLQECLFRVIIPTAEQWQMPAASLQVLQQACKRFKDDEVKDLASQQCFPETSRWKSLKLEAPALRSDHGTDCRRLARQVKAFMKEPLPDHRLPLHPVDVDIGEGLEFPKSMAQRDREQMKIAEGENLGVTKDTLVYLTQSLKSVLTEADQREFVESVSTYQGLAAREYLTPPLTPLLSALPEYFVPAAEACEIPEPSDPSSRLSEDIAAAEDKIFESEFDFWADVMEKDNSPGRYDDIDVSEMIRAGEFRPLIPPSSPQPVPRDLKVDVPLLPCSDDGGNNLITAKVLGPDDLAEAKELVASSDTLSGSDGPTGQLVKLFQKSETAVMRYAEQEKLQPLDATSRAAVPVLDFSIPVPEWEQRLWESKAMFRWIQKDIDVDWQGVKWPHNRAAEQRMVWAPLAHMKEKKLVSEKIEADIELLGMFLKRDRDNDVLTGADYVYKEPGVVVLRVVDDGEDDDDHLLPLNTPGEAPSNGSGDISWRKTVPSVTDSSLALPRSSPFTVNTATLPPADLTTLLRGRKRLIDETLDRGQSSGKHGWAAAISPEASATAMIDSPLTPSTNVLRGFMSEYTDFAPLVDNFVEMNFPKKPKLTHRSFFAPATTTPSPSQSKADEAAKLMPPPPKPIPALAPRIDPPAIPPRIVISTTTPAPLTQHLQTLLPGIQLIPRNPSKHRPAGWAPGQPSPNLDEADIVVSPATGILLTTMLNLRQRALPTAPAPPPPIRNTAPTSTFHRILANVAARHERLVVLVSEGNKHSESATPLSASDARALAELQGFAAGLRMADTADVEVVYVGGGVATLARWVAAVVCEYALVPAPALALAPGEVGGVREMLLPVETFWEVFLRRAGMNVYGAQVVLGRLKGPDGEGGPAVGGGGGRVFGLPAFVVMGRERRVEWFGEVFGGRRVLDRVSEVVDEVWGQEAVGEGGFDA